MGEIIEYLEDHLFTPSEDQLLNDIFHVVLLNYHSIVHIRTFKFYYLQAQKEDLMKVMVICSLHLIMLASVFEVICKW